MIRSVDSSGGRGFFLALALSIICQAASARSTTLDDSGSQALEPSVRMHWDEAVPHQNGGANLLTGATTIRVRINVTPWLGRTGRIFLALPAQQPGPIRMTWSTQGAFLPGQLLSGGRVLVYAGPITKPVMEEVFQFKFSVDGALMQRAFPVSYTFELEEP